ncbi:MAG: serine--tRNA ligase [Candidatus Doudnabacteria bacterium]|nr:serine--tRNA ligase [Candidatus Doudnabacteria bacterium]
MLDIKYIRDNEDVIKKAITDKRLSFNLDELLEVDAHRRELLAEVEGLQATKNAVSKEIPKLSEAEKKGKILEMQEIDTRQTEQKAILREVDQRYHALLLQVPNIPAPEAPIGPDESGNVPWSYWSPATGHVDPKDTGKVAEVPTKFEFEIKDHLALGQDLDLIDIEAGVKTSGFRGYYLKNQAVMLQQALIQHALKKLQQKGFTLFAPPTMVREFALVGSGHFPAGREEIYQIANSGEVEAGVENSAKESMYLVGTSEASLLAYYADKVFEEKDLPITVSGVSACYRSEVGSYGKDARGLYRIHEFQKVEQMVICKADIAESDKWLEALRETAEEILQDLKLPYRVLNICTGDMGAGKYKMYDIETWMPSRNGYGETHSDSSFTDWQARRINIRYKDSEGNMKFAYTLNNTAIASPRILIPLLENYQQADGSVVVPEVLRPYVGVDVIKSKSTK